MMMSRGAKDDDASTLEEAANEAYEAGEEEFGAGTSPEAGRHLKPHLPILMHLSVCKARLAENSR